MTIVGDEFASIDEIVSLIPIEDLNSRSPPHYAQLTATGAAAVLTMAWRGGGSVVTAPSPSIELPPLTPVTVRHHTAGSSCSRRVGLR